MRKKIVLMTGGTETLDYFSRQLDTAFQSLGYKTFLFDQTQEEESAEALNQFIEASDTILVTFNFDGIHYDTSLFDHNGQLIWDKYNVPCVNIAVDHPFYYPTILAIQNENFYAVSIDRYHMQYMDNYYPKLHNSLFLPLGGTSLTPNGNYKPLSERTYDVVFTGNFTPKETFLCHINRHGEEYAAFYQSILDELLENPDLPDDLVMEKHLLREFPEATKDEIKETISNMIFIDTYIRFYYREKTVQLLVDNGIHVHCIGHGWDKLVCAHPENLTYEKNQYSLACLERMADARLSLNIMPWFKDGAHDRVFNAMANGSVCITDHSKYLDEILEDNENVIFYDLKHLDELPKKIKALLANPSKMENISKKGYKLAMKHHTWASRANTLHEELLKHF